MCQHHRDCGEKTLNELEEPGRGQFSHFSLCPGGSSFLISSSCQSCRPYYQHKIDPELYDTFVTDPKSFSSLHQALTSGNTSQAPSPIKLFFGRI